MLGCLGQLTDLDAAGGEVFQGTGAEGMGDGAGMAGRAVSQVVAGRGFAGAGVDPAGGLVDGAEVSDGWIGVGDEEFEGGVLVEGAEDDAQDAGLGVGGKLIREPQSGEGEAVVGGGSLNQTVREVRSGAEGDGAQQTSGKEDAEDEAGTAGEGVEVVLAFEEGFSGDDGDGLDHELVERRGRLGTAISQPVCCACFRLHHRRAHASSLFWVLDDSS